MCCPHPSASGPGASSLSRVGVEVGPLGPLTAGIWLLELILALDLVSRTQTPAGSLLCVHTWPGLGRDDGAQGTVGVSEWKLTAHLPGPTYAGPAAQSLSSGLAGGAGGAGHRHWAQRGPWPVCLQVGGDVWVFRGPCMQRVGGWGRQLSAGKGSQTPGGEGEMAAQPPAVGWSRSCSPEAPRAQGQLRQTVLEVWGLAVRDTSSIVG